MLRSYHTIGCAEAGCDETGRGSLAGPVYAAAVILPENYRNGILNDSKLLDENTRDDLRHEIEYQALAWAVASVDAAEIDRINILNASILAMHRAIDKLRLFPEHLLVDGIHFKLYKRIPHTCVAGGDGQFASIAAASVLAKVYRDTHMRELAKMHPQYGWENNKGYATSFHRDAIIHFGITPYHRRSFQLLDPQMDIEFP